jgi:hypothetical protein
VRRLLALFGGLTLSRFVRRRREPQHPPDPRAEELRRKLAESRAMVTEREEFEAAELTIDLAEAAPDDPESRRRNVHEAARETVEQMRERGR